MVKSSFFYIENKETIKGQIINILSGNDPLSITGIYDKIKQENHFPITYQAIHKTVKQLVFQGCLEVDHKKYKLNIGWLNELQEFLNKTKKMYNLKKNNQNNIIVTLRENNIIWLKELISIYKNAFGKHHLFEKGEREVITYLTKIKRKNDLILFIDKGIVLGGVVVVREERDYKRKFSRWRLLHFACRSTISQSHRLLFLQKVLNKLKEHGKKNKIHYEMAETEKEYICLFELAGFHKEATLSDFFRPGETGFIYSKLI